MPASKPEKLWIVDDDQSIRWVLQKALEKAGMEVQAYEFASDLVRDLNADNVQLPEAIISDIRMPGMSGFELIKEIHSKYPELPVIIMTAHSDMDSAMSAYESGAFEYLPKPFDINEATDLAKRACATNKSTSGKIAEVEPVVSQQEIIGQSVAMQELFRSIGRLSKTSISVLITGESGTGKELVAKALHTHSPRAKKSFIAINTAAIPKELLESELFGHEKGSFTGAQAQRIGRFEQADGGTLFLDEIGDMPAELQTRLLRVLADGEFYRVGGTKAIRVDVRVVAATHQNLEEHVKNGTFREDLFHRLNVIRLQIPALRERDEDIIVLLNHFLAQAAKELNAEQKKLSSEVSDYLQTLDWPGNVRQLENVSRWLTVMAAGHEITMEDLPQDLKQSEEQNERNWEALLYQNMLHRLNRGDSRILDEVTPKFETIALNAALQKTGGRKKDAAELLGWGRNTLTRKLKELDISKGEPD
ncbi:nitrogen regulation protein NR(I) [uncultured Cocleimonas sp.]|uniref:nitrogen regulation protein NR(I) n=1 Tax=uncultured Cocleimonas sp. TaxID=1051587 RepID=UPI002613431B|nr:nitrogen regulation protein NR(I) [uncultured Cocleimonas sp.]